MDFIAAAPSGTILAGIDSTDPGFVYTPTLGVPSSHTGTLSLADGAAGDSTQVVTLAPQSPASPIGGLTLKLPNTVASTGQVLTATGVTGGNTVTLGFVNPAATGVTSIATTSPITGGTITSTGTIACPTCVTSAANLTSNQLVLGAGGQGSATLGTTGTATTVLHGGAGVPTFSAVGLTTDVTGILPIANGGTGNATGTATNVSGIVGTANGGTGVNSSSTTANQIFASPNGSTGAPTFRAMVAKDLPTPQNTRTICYVAGADNTTTAPVLTTNDSQNSFFFNLIGTMTATSIWCQTNLGTATVQLQQGATLLNSTAMTCSTAGVTGTLSSTAIAANASLNFIITANPATATRITACVAATVN